MKGTSKSQTKNNKFEDYKICLDGEENENECSNYLLKLINHDIYLQETRKSTFSIFDDKRKRLENIESLPWN